VNFLATLLVAFSLAAPRTVPVPQPVSYRQTAPRSHPKGIWYLAENGHAVYCYGPVRLMTQPDGGLVRVATFCRGDQIVVPLRD
jgi:hypothetical protein